MPIVVKDLFYNLSQGLADAFILMRYPFESDEARQLNIEIFETIYFAALTVRIKLVILIILPCWNGQFESKSIVKKQISGRTL